MHFVNEEENTKGKAFDKKILKRLLPYIYPYTWMFVYCLIIMSGVMAAEVIGPKLIQIGIDVEIANKSISGLLYIAGGFAVITILSLILGWILTVNLETVGQKILRKLRLELFQKLLYMPVRYYTENPVGKLVARVESDSEAVRVFFTTTTILLVESVLMLTGIFTVMFLASPELTLKVSWFLPILLIASLVFIKKVRPIFLNVRKKVADICAFVTENLQGMKVVQTFNQQDRVFEEMESENREKFNIHYPGERLYIVFWNCVNFTYYLGIIIILWVGCANAVENPLTLGVVIMFILYLEKFFGPIRILSDQLNIMQRAFAAGERIFGILGSDCEINDPKNPVAWETFQSEITFENVWFSYKENEWVLKNVSFKIPIGESWALVGSTGSGKTTIISLILRFYDPQKGRILVDGIDIKNIPQKVLREKFSFVQQDIFLFPGTVLDNLRLMDEDISEEKVHEAIKIVQAQKSIERLPKGMDTEIAERGQNLSQGECQLLSFARALVFDPQIFILDEATSSVDPATEQKIQKALEQVLDGRTGLIVAHRLATVRKCDNILVISDGEIIESGNHKKLLKLDGHYAKMHCLQFEEDTIEERDYV